jgi:ribosomal protein S18 acetylase RimI-like enzyme
MSDINSQMVFELLSRVDSDFYPPLSSRLNLKCYAEKIKDKASLFFRLEANVLIGLCAAYATDKVKLEAYLTMLAVDPSYRGLGVAKSLIKEMEAKLSLEGFNTIKLEVYKANLGAFSMYKSLGYLITEETDNSYFLLKNIADY